MTNVLLATDLGAGTGLAALLLVTIAGGPIRIRPTPGKGTWQSRVFWSLFRTLNVAALPAVVSNWGSLGLGLVPDPVRGAGLSAVALCARRVPRFYTWRRTRACLRLGQCQLAPLPRRLAAPAVRHLAATG